MNLGFAKFLDRVGGSLIGRAIGAVDGLRELFGAPPAVAHVQHVLIVKFWGLGNWALLRPIVHDIRARFPGARLTIATLRANQALVRDLADDLLLVDPTRATSIGRDLLRGIRQLRRETPDLAIDFEQFSRTGALLARLGGVPQRLGFRSGHRGRDGLYTVTIPFRTDAHVTRSFRDLAEAAGVQAGPYIPGGLSIEPDLHAALRVRHGLGEEVVVIHPGSGDNFPGRRWSAAGFAAAGRAAVQAGAEVVVTGGRGEQALAEDVTRRIGTGARTMAGMLSIEELIALLGHARVLLSNDTGPVHLASQVGTPVLAFFGPNTPILYGPLSAGSRAFYRDLPCSPCLTTANYRSSRCRIHTCMHTIATGEVVEQLKRLLAAEPVGSRP